MGRKRTDLAARERVGVHRKIREAREAAGFSVEQMAGFLDVHELTYVRIEAGLISLTAERLSAIARVLQVTVGALFGEGVAA